FPPPCPRRPRAAGGTPPPRHAWTSCLDWTTHRAVEASDRPGRNHPSPRPGVSFSCGGYQAIAARSRAPCLLGFRRRRRFGLRAKKVLLSTVTAGAALALAPLAARADQVSAAAPLCAGVYADDFAALSAQSREFDRQPQAAFSYCTRNTAT